MVRGAFTCVKSLAVLCAALAAAGTELACHRPPPTVASTRSVPAVERQVNVLALGDWGDDTRGQARVAEGMADYTESRVRGRLDAVLALGDNFYVPLRGVDDPQWDRLFERMFERRRLNVPFY